MRSRLLITCLMVSSLLPLAAARAAEPLIVLAAASLTDAMKDISNAWEAKGHPALRLSFGASSTLARQIEQGASATLFASADQQWMDYLDKRGLLAPGTRRDLLSNELVLIVPANHPTHVTIGANFDLASLLGPNGRLATGDPAHVPVGLYAKQALEKLGSWSTVESRLAPAPDVRGALLLVERGEAPAGIVYATDAAISKGVMIAGVFPASSHDPITYPFALLRGQDTDEGKTLMNFVSGPEARAIFTKFGFGVE